MIKLNVWLTIEKNSPIPAGELVVSDLDLRGALRGQFRYSQNFLNWKNRFSLDPVHLPLSTDIFNADRPYSGIHGVFEDSLPDDWGRKLLVRKYNISRKEQRPPKLLFHLGGNGMGALSYSYDDKPPEREEPPDLKNLENLLDLAAKFEKDADYSENELTLLFQAGSSPGGARPKVLIQDEDVPYIAKFRSIKDKFDIVSLEAASMAMAKEAGINTASTRCVNCSSNKILLVERFDVNFSEKRSHIISMQTLLGADNYYHLGYRNMADILKKVSFNPEEDLPMLLCYCFNPAFFLRFPQQRSNSGDNPDIFLMKIMIHLCCS